MHSVEFNRLAWIPMEALGIHVATVCAELSITVRDPITDESTRFSFYEIDKIRNVIGVPRNYFLNRFDLTKYNVIDQTSKSPALWPKLQFPPGFSYREGQKEAIDGMIAEFQKGKYGGCLEAKAGSGKTLMALDIASRLQVSALVLTHKDDLMVQWQKTVNDFFPGCRTGMIKRDALYYQQKDVVFGSFQTLYSRMDSFPSDLFNSFGFVIVDEGHRVPAKTFEMVFRRFNPRYRMAVSATFRRKDGLECVWNWHIGPVLVKAKTTHLTGDYIQVRMVTGITTKEVSIGGKVHLPKLITALTKSEVRNKWLIDQLIKAVDAKRKVALLTDRVEHCKLLKSMLLLKLAQTGQVGSIGLYIGGLTESERKEVSKKRCIIGTFSMFAEGTDIADLDTLILASPHADIEQPVGRIQRAVEKKSLLVVDVVDEFSMCARLAVKRKDCLDRLGFVDRNSKEKD